MVLDDQTEQNTMIKTIQYFTEADSSRVLDLKAAFQDVYRRSLVVQHRSKRCGRCSCLLQMVHWYTKISADCGVDQGCPLSTCGFSSAIEPVLRSVPAEIRTQYDSSAQLFGYLDDWNVCIKPQYLPQTNICSHGSSHQVSQP